MTLQQTLFIISGAITLVAALMVVTRRNVLHAALFLILSFLGIAGLYVLLEAHFLAAVQLFIYIGGITTLIVFAVMVTRACPESLGFARDKLRRRACPERSRRDMMNPNIHRANRNVLHAWWAAALVVVALCGMLGWVILNHDWDVAPSPVPEHSIAIPGAALADLEEFALPFEVTSVLLLVTLIGAATIVRER